MMAEPLLSLTTVGTMKHVVPWKTRSDFLDVYKDLYSSDLTAQESAIGRIAAWKSRVGSKLSVAIESSGMLKQVCLQHEQARASDKIHQMDSQLRCGYSLALIRFVNHVTEKAQTKAVAQPVHLTAREFGIPEWIVRLRHDATHGSLPSLDTLASGAAWAVDYLRENFWEHQQRQAVEEGGNQGQPGRRDNSGRQASSADIKAALNEFITIRLGDPSKSKDNMRSDTTLAVTKLMKFLALDRLKFVKCLLEDGFLVAAEHQLDSYELDLSDLSELPPTIPKVTAVLWRPLLKALSNVPGVLALFLHTSIFSVTSECNLHNYQLVAWIRLILSATLVGTGNKRRRPKKGGWYIKTSQPIPKQTLLTACINNINAYTVHLLRYLVDADSLGEETHAKVTHLLQLADQNTSLLSEGTQGETSDEGSGSESDTFYTTKDVKSEGDISSRSIEEIERSFNQGSIQWSVCTDVVDWSTIPLGVLPDSAESLAANCSDDEEVNGDSGDDNSGGGRFSSAGRSKRQRRRRARRGESSRNDDDDDYEDSDNQDIHTKRSKLIVTDDLLI